MDNGRHDTSSRKASLPVGKLALIAAIVIWAASSGFSFLFVLIIAFIAGSILFARNSRAPETRQVDKAIDPYEEGRNAGIRGSFQNANPYCRHSEKEAHDRWWTGWNVGYPIER